MESSRKKQQSGCFGILLICPWLVRHIFVDDDHSCFFFIMFIVVISSSVIIVFIVMDGQGAELPAT